MSFTNMKIVEISFSDEWVELVLKHYPDLSDRIRAAARDKFLELLSSAADLERKEDKKK